MNGQDNFLQTLRNIKYFYTVMTLCNHQILTKPIFSIDYLFEDVDVDDAVEAGNLRKFSRDGPLRPRGSSGNISKSPTQVNISNLKK